MAFTPLIHSLGGGIVRVAFPFPLFVIQPTTKEKGNTGYPSKVEVVEGFWELVGVGLFSPYTGRALAFLLLLFHPPSTTTINTTSSLWDSFKSRRCSQNLAPLLTSSSSHRSARWEISTIPFLPGTIPFFSINFFAYKLSHKRTRNFQVSVFFWSLSEKVKCWVLVRVETYLSRLRTKVWKVFFFMLQMHIAILRLRIVLWGQKVKWKLFASDRILYTQGFTFPFSVFFLNFCGKSKF